MFGHVYTQFFVRGPFLWYLFHCAIFLCAISAVFWSSLFLCVCRFLSIFSSVTSAVSWSSLFLCRFLNIFFSVSVLFLVHNFFRVWAVSWAYFSLYLIHCSCIVYATLAIFVMQHLQPPYHTITFSAFISAFIKVKIYFILLFIIK